MASNTPTGGWRVKVVSLPESVTHAQLTQIFALPYSCVYLPKVDDVGTCYAWIENFTDEEDANKFAKQWTNSTVFGRQIKCIVKPPIIKQDILRPSHKSSRSGNNKLSHNKPGVSATWQDYEKCEKYKLYDKRGGEYKRPDRSATNNESNSIETETSGKSLYIIIPVRLLFKTRSEQLIQIFF
ncbi:unnamed protein product [Adineta steineri]|uniref:RRM domain-containing protein n=1 Tax=Adineta steineri TaxID=433720 RepID=A0A814U1V7_9BILA|nr:unnamed protein product [Adineta steineri]CAF1393725.1 unnamed protein product [Adineta steineri]